LLALFGGPLPGVFALGMLTRRANSRGVIIGSVASIAGTIWIQNFTTLHFFFHAFVAFVISLVVGYLASLWPRQPLDAAKVQGLTIWDLGPVGPGR
jgi:Na+/proline symporter